MKICIVFFIIFKFATAGLYFVKDIKCIKQDDNKCLDWYSNGTINFQSASCFPSHTLVLTKNGPKTMKSLKIGDQILAYNKQANKDQYVTVYAWLHRIQTFKFEFFKVETKDFYFYSSAKHNIATGNKEDPKYVFTKDLEKQNLILQNKNSNQTSLVEKVTREIDIGIYAPYTQFSNFYIVAENKYSFNSTKTNNLVLVHSFSDIPNPQNYQTMFYYSIRIAQFLGLNRQPQPKQEYLHPLAKFYVNLFPGMIEHQSIYGHYYSHHSGNGLFGLVDLGFRIYADTQRSKQRSQAIIFRFSNLLAQFPITL